MAGEPEPEIAVYGSRGLQVSSKSTKHISCCTTLDQIAKLLLWLLEVVQLLTPFTRTEFTSLFQVFGGELAPAFRLLMPDLEKKDKDLAAKVTTIEARLRRLNRRSRNIDRETREEMAMTYERAQRAQELHHSIHKCISEIVLVVER